MLNLRSLLLSARPAASLEKRHRAGALALELPELANLDINDAYSSRHKNNFYHSIKVLSQAIALEKQPDLILRTAALLHDVGKPATRQFDSKGNVSFTNHETVGAAMIPSILKGRGYSKDEVKAVKKLVALHMRSYNFDEALWTDSALRRLIKDVGSNEQLERLFIIFKADVTTKLDKKRISIHNKVDALRARVLQVQEELTLEARRPALDGHKVMELFGLTPGPQLGALMKYLNSEEGLKLSEAEAIEALKRRVETL